MTKKTTPADYYFVGYRDGIENNPKQTLKGVNATTYANGYAAGHRERSQKSPFVGKVHPAGSEYATVWQTAESRAHGGRPGVTFFATRPMMDAWIVKKQELAVALKSSVDISMFVFVDGESHRLYK